MCDPKSTSGKLSSGKKSFTTTLVLTTLLYARILKIFLENCGYPPVSPKLVSSDYFQTVQKVTWWFENDEEFKTAIVNWFNSQAANFDAEVLKKMVQLYEKCF